MADAIERVKELLKLPQSLCRTCGKCCKVVSFKNGLSYREIKALAEQDINSSAEASQIEGARDFLSIFVPYESIQEIEQVNLKLVEDFQKNFNKDITKEQYFFYCKFLSKDNLCLIHEDRPSLCRMYPIPHERTLFHDDCGFEKQAKENWRQIQLIMKELEESLQSYQKQLEKNKTQQGEKDGDN